MRQFKPPSTIKQLLAASSQLQQPLDKSTKLVTINGWLQTTRIQKTMAFLHVNDGSCTDGLQAVVDSSSITGLADSLHTGACVSLTGTLKNVGQERTQAVELAVQQIKVLGKADPSVSCAAVVGDKMVRVP